MPNYVLTVFDKSGKKLMDETFSADNNEEAKTIGQKLLDEKGYSEHTHRCVSPQAKLVLFHR
ncbi:YhzD family protein [Oceanobacillus senegalensis]|uniref:YhzD family protein n=1 Tax=Oceanobacillus senegalensis TaxID=1936063 RepID=UPI000A3080D5|nr:YhzD family protein [Oceanobacillus senegalensis]